MYISLKTYFMNIVVNFGITLLSLFLGLSALAQPLESFDSDLNEQLTLAQQQMVDGNYDKANLTFRKILRENKVLPPNLSYLFAETLYKIGQFQNSRNFLDKYLSVEGKGSDYYEEAQNLLKYLNIEFADIKSCSRCDIRGYRLLVCHECHGERLTTKPCHYCKAVGVIACQKCQGEGVVISKNVFGEYSYETCNRCSNRGQHDCPVCSGKKQITTTCAVCLGSGQESSTHLCNHERHTEKLNDN